MILKWVCILQCVYLVASLQKLNFHALEGVEYFLAVFDEEGDELRAVKVASLKDVERHGEVVAGAAFSNAINSTGWAYLEIWTDPSYDDSIQARAAGYVEGVATADLTYMHYYNTLKSKELVTLRDEPRTSRYKFPNFGKFRQNYASDKKIKLRDREIQKWWSDLSQSESLSSYYKGYCDGREAYCSKLSNYLKTNTDWVMKMVKKKRIRDPYWHQVGLYYEQLDGMAEAWSLIGEITDFGPLWLNIAGDLEELAEIFGGTTSRLAKLKHKHGMPNRWDHVLGDGSCSALIKVLPGNKDLYVSHVTWNTYEAMIRILKRYNFGFHKTADPSSDQIIGSSIAFSSYPGVIYSTDDFHLISSGLVTQETTIGNYNADLWEHVKSHGQVLEGCRVTVANRLASTGEEWTSIFRKRNSGTYNNQWMIVDYKLFKAGKKKLHDGLLWVIEQLPGHIKSEDATWRLRTETHWPSYNSPYFSEIRNLSGTNDLIAKYGDWFSYDKTPRALIFQRDHHKVDSVESMIKLMRYNDYTEDPLSHCDCNPPYSSENTISARNDLNPVNGTYPFGSLGHRCHGGTDMKMTSYGMFKKLQFVAVNGPTFDPLPPFQWSKTDFDDRPRLGHPDVFKFNPVVFQWHSSPLFRDA